MRLLELELQDLPGLPGRLVLKDVPAGALVVLGPNGSGKTSLARGMGCLLFPDRQAQGLGHAVWLVDEQRVHARFGPGRPLRFEPAAPPIADARLRRLYFLDLDSFRAKEGSDDVAAELRRELGAGYDLSSVSAARRKGWGGPRPVLVARKELLAARQQRQGVQAQHAALETQRTELEGLRAQRTQAQGAAARVLELERALLVLQLLQEGEDAAGRLSKLPVELGRLEANDGSLLKRLLDRRAQLEEECMSRAADRDRLQGERTELTAVEGLGQLVQGMDLLALEREVREAEAELQEAERKRLNRELPQGARPLVPSELDALEQLVDRVQVARAEVRRLGPEPAREEDPAPAGVEVHGTLEEGRAALRRWLEEEPMREARSQRARWELAGATLALVLCIALWLFDQPNIALWVAMGSLVAAMVALLWPQRQRSQDLRAREARRFGETALAPPSAWTSALVARRLHELERDAVEVQAQRERLATTQRLRGEWQTAHNAHNAAKEALEEFARARGLHGAAGDLGLLDLARRMADLVEIHERVELAQRRLERARDARSQARSKLEPKLAAAGVALPSEAFSAQALLERIRAQTQRLERVRGELEHAERELATLGARRNVAEGELTALCTRLDLPPADPMPRLLELQRLEPAYREARADEERCQRELARLTPSHEELEHLRTRGTEALFAERDTERARANGLEEWNLNIGKIEERLERAAGGDELEAALFEVQRLEAELAATAKEGLRVGALEFLLNDVQVEHDRAPRSELLQRAADLLSRFTEGSVELLPPGTSDDGSRERGFRLTTERGEPRTPEQLSSGTLAQLELALRIAVVERVERGVEMLPLFLDEVLTHSDPARFAAVAGALCELTRQGRQVLFATSDPVDAERFARAFEAAGEARPGRVNIGASQPTPAPAEWLAFDAPKPVISPEGLEAAEYGELLKVPAADAFAPVGALHLFHLFRDRLDLVHRLDRACVRTVAQLDQQMGRGMHVGEDIEREFAPRRAVFEAAWNAFREGRAPRFPAEVVLTVLETSNKRDEVLGAAEEVGFDGALLLAQLRGGRVYRLNEKWITELEQRLEEGGHLPQGEALWGETLVARALDLLPAGDAAERARAADWAHLALLALAPNHRATEAGGERL